MKTFCFCIIFATVGCASLNREAYENIKVGDKASHVKDVLGEPDRFANSVVIPGATAWYYVRRGDVCGFTIKDDEVKYMTCGRNPNYVSPGAAIGTVLKGAGDGMQNANRTPAPVQRPVTCTPNPGGVNAYGMTCQ